MQSASEIFYQIVEIERQIESGEAKGKLTALKAAHRKLSALYVKARMAEAA